MSRPSEPEGRVPVACRIDALDPDERRAHAQVLDELRRLCGPPDELPDGYSLGLPDSPAAWEKAHEWIALERRCCPFFTFVMMWRAGASGPTLEVTGPPGAKEILGAALQPPPANG